MKAVPPGKAWITRRIWWFTQKSLEGKLSTEELLQPSDIQAEVQCVMCIWSPNWECGTSIHPLSGSQKIAVKIGFQAANRNDLERKLNGRKERNARNKLRRTIVLCGIDGSEE